MWKKVIIAFILLVPVALYLLLSDTVWVEYPPRKPPGLSAGFAWAGGYDGGFWVKCESSNLTGEQRFFCDVYTERGEQVLERGVYQPFKVIWNAEAKQARYEKLDFTLTELSFSGINGRDIVLTDGLVLRPVLQ